MRRISPLRTGVLLLAMSFTLAACSEKEESSAVHDKESAVEAELIYSFEHPETMQKFKIVNAYKLFDSYADRVEKAETSSKYSIYKDEVISPVYDKCFEDGEYIHMADPILDKAPENLKEIQSVIEKINENKTNEIIKEALLKSSGILPGKRETVVCVFPVELSEDTPLMVNAGAGKITVFFNKYYTGETIRMGIAHEYHHSVWTEEFYDGNLDVTVLDNLIFEGKAVMFEKLVYPDIRQLTPINQSFNKTNWSKIEKDLDKVDGYRSSQIIMGGGELPLHYGYSEGYKMVDSYLKLHPGSTPKEWTALGAEEIFQEGQYVKNYQ
ncbi:DUF2268 domain-containing putative Zn-dependent protease [Cytobacillus firmus]|uniref:DUF2268 domain-containing protein n=1 Tax=Cytobacillus firmus TaxID=1399 RepID=A0A800MTI8_CYTFI|nr:DUF2268 domain-containing putative Zn-dependent protease [Cytobacillus firmus]KAF0822243.1 hypothetical protein KIS1582_3958 [Cytobacillus firmus]MDD9313914.1 DUF2268 domain-containing putative Zn-dependent protease [Cytobacillus firmus]MED1907184.1 DUF2268 domain-containing putative Zn-dependent protease [Cytobacillus firmus]MED1942908.1 DUF2268 domain-containing putative Zn-dependent protease [Cytobacillus firmus]